MENTEVTLHSRLKELREEAGLSQSALSDALGVAQTSIGNYERGERSPDSDVIIKYSTHFNVSTDYLLGRSSVKKHEKEERGYKVTVLLMMLAPDKPYHINIEISEDTECDEDRA